MKQLQHEQESNKRLSSEGSFGAITCSMSRDLPGGHGEPHLSRQRDNVSKGLQARESHHVWELCMFLGIVGA